MLRLNLISLCTTVYQKTLVPQTFQIRRDFSHLFATIELKSIPINQYLNNKLNLKHNSYYYHSLCINLRCLSLWKFKSNKMKDILLTNEGPKTEIINNLKNGINTDSKTNSSPQMSQLINGKKIAEEIRVELREQIVEWVRNGHRAPHLTAVLVGDDPASQTYVRNKVKAAADVGITTETKRLTSDITETELLDIISDLNNDNGVDGILVQLPVPKHIDERVICDSISCNKDVDGFNEKNVGRLCLDMNTLIPCTALGVQELLKRTNVDTFGKNAVVIGRSKNVGLPIFMLLHADGRNDTCAMDATVTMCHRFTPPAQLKEFCLNADIIVSATGVPGLVTADMVKPGACIIDVGITRVNDEATGQMKLVGDVDFDEVRKVAGHITPVPGGVGPMTVTMLMKNTFIAAKNLVRIQQNNSSRD